MSPPSYYSRLVVQVRLGGRRDGANTHPGMAAQKTLTSPRTSIQSDDTPRWGIFFFAAVCSVIRMPSG